ncbi:hypothetical protein EIN_462390, partial [Entamoeba invadens IP1]
MAIECITFDEALFATDVDILSGVLKYFCAKGKSEAETKNNLRIFFGFFAGSDKLFELLYWVVEREITDASDRNTVFIRNSVYNNIIHIFFQLDFVPTVYNIIDNVVSKIEKHKIFVKVSDPAEKNFKKIKEVAKYLVDQLILSKFSP